MAKDNTKNLGHFATAKAMNLQVSTKHCIEICRSLRYKKTSFAKKFLEEVASLKRAVPFRRFNKDVGHKAGMASGRFPRNAAREMLKLINSVEANAQVKGLNTSNLKITKILANKAAVPITGGRHRTGTKRTHVEVEVKEGKVEGKKSEVKKEPKKKESKKTETPAEKVKEAKKEVEKKVESKTETVKSVQPEVKQEEKTVETKPTTSVQKEEAKETPATKPQEEVKEEKKEKPVLETVKEQGQETTTQAVGKQVKEEVAKAPVQENLKPTPVEEPSPAELLKKAQEKAEELNKKEKQSEDTKEVSNLYKELQKKGSLRHKRDTP